MIEDARGVMVATTHAALRMALKELGAECCDAVGPIDAAVETGAAAGVVASQDFPGLNPDVVRRWAGHGVPVLVWLEADPPPAWRNAIPGVEVVAGEIDDADIRRWIHASKGSSDFGRDARLLGVLGMGRPVATVAAVWANQLAGSRGPGLLVDADWSGGGLTEALAGHVWGRVWDYTSLRPVAVPSGQLAPAPPPWETGFAGGMDGVVDEVGRRSAWILVDLGSDFRRNPALVWVPRLDVIAMDAADHRPTRIRETVSVLRTLNPGATLGCRGVGRTGLDGVVGLGEEWPRAHVRSHPRRSRPGRAVTAFLTRIREHVLG